jgi:hypothetical protein
MSQLSDQITRISEKLQLVLRQLQVLQKENERLRGQLEQERRNQQVRVLEIEQLQQQAEILKLSRGEMKESEKKAFQKRLNQYIKEIDRCISLLNE